MNKNTVLNLSVSSNGSMVTAFMPKKNDLTANQNFSYYDLQSLSSDKVEDVSLGLIKSFEYYEKRPISLISKAFENKNFIYYKPGAKIKWDEPVGIEYNSILQCVTEGDWLGVDGTTFEARIKYKYVVGDIIGRANPYDADMEANFMVHDVYEAVGGGFIHELSITPNSQIQSISREYLKPGIQLVFLDHPTGEYSTNLSGLESYIRPTFISKEVDTHAPTGVEAHVTAEGMITGIDRETKETIQSMTTMMDLMGDKGEQFLLGLGMRYDSKAPSKNMKGEDVVGGFVRDNKNMKPIMLGMDFIEYWVMTTALQKANTRMSYSRGFQGKTQSNHNVSSGVGAWVQIKNGARKLEYPSIDRFGLADLALLSETVYQGTGIEPKDRVLDLNCGVYINAKIESLIQINSTQPMPFVTNVSDLPNNPISGTGKPFEWAYNAPRFTEGYLPGVGYVRTERDMTLDTQGGDPYLNRMDGHGNTKGGYTIMVSSRNKAISDGLKKSKDSIKQSMDMTGSDNANIYILRKQDAMGNAVPLLSYGKEVGRQYGIGVNSTTKEMGNTYWSIVDGQALVLNPSDIVIMELA